MITLQKALIALGALVLLVVSGLLYKRHYDNQKKLEGQLQFLIKDVARRDSITSEFLSKLSIKLDAQILTATKTIEHWHSVTEKVPVMIAGRIDSVFKDSVFAKLPDSVKVRVLLAAGTSVANSCSEALNTCQIFKDSANVQFARKDSLIGFWQLQYKIKPRRACGPGGTVGAGGGFGLFTRKPDVFLGAAVGITCSF